MNSRVIDGDMAGAVKRERRDVIIIGSLGVVHAQCVSAERAGAAMLDRYRRTAP